MAVVAARAKSLFLALSEIPNAAERAVYLERECGGDAELRDRVEALLRANDAAPLPPLKTEEGTSAHVPDRQQTEDYGDPTARVGSVVAGKYKLIEEIGEGGMGQVFMAQQTEPVKRAVAIKVIKAGMDSKAVLTRFEAERQALAMMDHPNIAKVLDAGTTDGGRPYFVMELVKGLPITKFCDDRKLTPRQRLELFIPVCQAIQHAHQKGVIHRDIKPSNVLVAMYDDRPVPKVIDFGVAKAAGQTLTEKTLMTGFGAIVGTPEYMSPEQANMNNLDIDTRSDVYSLGVLLYELLTGTTPVDRKSLGKAALLEILRIVREVEAQKPSHRLSTAEGLPSVAANRGTEPAKLSSLMKGELDWVVLKALEKDRIRRYDTANALSRDIQRYLADEVVEARPPSAGYQLRKFIRRNRFMVAAVTAGFLLLILATITGLVIREQFTQQQKATRAAGLVQAVQIADTVQVPAIIEEISAYRQWVDPLLWEANKKAADQSRQKLHTSLALLPVDSGQVEYLYSRLLKAEPQEVMVIRGALFEQKADLKERWWKLLENSKTEPGQRLRTASALAAFDPNDTRWEKVSSDVAAILVNQEPFVIALWTEALKGARRWLIPPMADYLTDEKRTLPSRGLISKVYDTYAADLPDAYTRLEKHLDETPPPSSLFVTKKKGTYTITTKEFDVDPKLALARKQASIGIALMVMGRSNKVWPLLKHSSDPTLRSYMIERCALGGVDHNLLIGRFEKEQEASIKQAILQSLGEYGLDRLVPFERSIMLPKLLQLYKDDPDPGIHSAAELLLRQWQATDELKKIDKELMTGKVEGKRQWYLNRQGDTMVVIAKPGEFWMGSEWGNELRRHRRRVDRNYAMASKEVTVDQFLRFRDGHNYQKEYVPTDDCPVNQVSWYDAVAYCNWLSEQEGIPKEQLCYKPNKDGKYADGMTMAADYLKRTGYRLPTEAEWEYACRAGTDTEYSCGDSEDYLVKYGWTNSNSLSKSHPVGSLKSNDLGLFDMHGNDSEWCQDMYFQYPKSTDYKAIDDTEGTTSIPPKNSRVLRGGNFLYQSSDLRSASRSASEPSGHFSMFGFRVARTLPP